MIMAFVEGLTGVVLFAAPALAVSMLLGTPLDPPGIFAGRVAGAALIALAVACWQARNNERGPSTGLIAAMLFFNEAYAFLLVYASVQLGLQTAYIWPFFVLHQALSVWCMLILWMTRRKLARAAVSDVSETAEGGT